MLSNVNLRKTGTNWEFESEEALEDFVWANLPQLFGLTPLKRQYTVKGKVCDILALAENKQLVVLELKNVEDRYVVQQLTRYYDALREEKPFIEQVDYEQPIRLIAVTPSFHRDNFTDRKYSLLAVQFLLFKILADAEKFYFMLKHLDNGRVSEAEILYQGTDITENIPEPPRKLINLLAKCNNSSNKEKEAVLRIRSKTLSFDRRMKELVEGNTIYYGKGKNKACVEIKFNTSYGFLNRPNLFLRLPEPDPGYREAVVRMHILTDENWDTFSGMMHYPKAFISPKIRSCTWYNFPSFIEIIKRFAEQPESTRGIQCYKSYEKLIESETNSLEILVEIALANWLLKL